MCIPLGNGDGALVDGQSVYVERGSEVDGGAHRAEAVDTQEVVTDSDGRRFLAVELSRDGTVLQVQRLAVGANNHVRFGGRRGRRGRRETAARFGTGGGFEVDAVDGRGRRVLQTRDGEVGSASWFWYGEGRTRGRWCLDIVWDRLWWARSVAGVLRLTSQLPHTSQTLLRVVSHDTLFFGLHATHVGDMWYGGRGSGRDVAGDAYEGLDAGGQQLQGGEGRDLEDVVGLSIELGGGDWL